MDSFKLNTVSFFYTLNWGFPSGSDGKESTCNAGYPGEANGNTLQYSCLENPMDRGAWWATVHGITRVGHD